MVDRLQGKVNILDLLADENTRLQAAEMVMGRPVDPKDINITQHLIGIMDPSERLAMLLMERASETP